MHQKACIVLNLVNNAALGSMGIAVQLVLLLLVLHGVFSQQSESAFSETHQNSSTAAVSSSSEYLSLKLPEAAVFNDPWTKQNIALTYAHRLKDGVGAQAMRMLELYAVANSLGIRHLHRPITCVGHVGGLVHYREAACNLTREADIHLLNKIRHMISLPSSVEEEQIKTWEHRYISEFTWWKFVALANEALKNKRPTLFITEFATSVGHQYPDVFYTVPALRPTASKARLVCDKPSSGGNVAPGRPWLLNALRVAIHFRRGDIATSARWSHRMFPPTYYINVAKQISQVLDAAGCNYAFEIYTEAPTSETGKQELDQLTREIPHAVLLVSKDMMWTWQMMATADILVMSNSAFSVSAALLNPNAFIVFFPGAQVHQTRVHLRHWHTPLDKNGTLPLSSLQQLEQHVNCTDQETPQANAVFNAVPWAT